MNAPALQFQLNLGAADHLNLLHHAHNSCLAVVTNYAGWNESMYKKRDAVAKAEQLAAAKVSDCYVGQNPFTFGKRRTFSNVSCLANCFVDLDIYGVPELAGVDKRDLLQRILFEHPTMPCPTMFADSGRGMYLIWTFKTTKPASFLPAWQEIENNLVELLQPFGADPKCRDVSRVLRISETENSKSATLADYEQISEPVRFEDLQKFSNSLTKAKKQQQQNKRQQNKRTPAKVSQLNAGFGTTNKNIFTLAYSRMQDIRTLAKLRGGLLTDLRKTALYAYAMAAAWYCPTVQSLENELLEFMGDCLANHSAYRQHMPTTVIKRKAQSLEGVTVEWRGGEYDARYRVRNSTLIKLLAITPAEQQHLSCLISTEEKQRRNTQRKATKRRSRGVVERSEYEHKAQERRQQALDLKGTGMTQAAIAEALGVSQNTVSGYLSK